jgi:hypothetical protein
MPLVLLVADNTIMGPKAADLGLTLDGLKTFSCKAAALGPSTAAPKACQVTEHSLFRCIQAICFLRHYYKIDTTRHKTNQRQLITAECSKLVIYHRTNAQTAKNKQYKHSLETSQKQNNWRFDSDPGSEGCNHPSCCCWCSSLLYSTAVGMHAQQHLNTTI